MGLLDNYLLTAITFFPLAVGLGLVATSVLAGVLRSRGLPASLWRAVGLASSLLTFLLSLRLLVRFDATQTGFQLVEYGPWIPDYGIHYFLGIDGISLFLVVLTTFLVPIVLLASWRDIAGR